MCSLKRLTHTIFAFALFSYTDMLFKNEVIFYAVITVLSSIIPDLDLRFKHRKLLHNIFAPLLFSALLNLLLVFLGIYPYYFILALLVGWMSHIVLDMLTKRGVYIFYPILDHGISLKICNSNSLFWNSFIIVISLMIITNRTLPLISTLTPFP